MKGRGFWISHHEIIRPLKRKEGKTMPKAALGESDVQRELEAIRKAWAALADLDTAARKRALEWLDSWVRSEAPGGSDETF